MDQTHRLVQTWQSVCNSAKLVHTHTHTHTHTTHTHTHTYTHHTHTFNLFLHQPLTVTPLTLRSVGTTLWHSTVCSETEATNQVFWETTPCRLVKSRTFRWIICLQGLNNPNAGFLGPSNKQLFPRNLSNYLPICTALFPEDLQV